MTSWRRRAIKQINLKIKTHLKTQVNTQQEFKLFGFNNKYLSLGKQKPTNMKKFIKRAKSLFYNFPKHLVSAINVLIKNLHDMFFFHSETYGGEVISDEAVKAMSNQKEWKKIQKQIDDYKENRMQKDTEVPILLVIK